MLRTCLTSLADPLKQKESEPSHREREGKILMTYRGRTEKLPVQPPLAMDIVLAQLHLKPSRLALEHLGAIQRPHHLDVAS